MSPFLLFLRHFSASFPETDIQIDLGDEDGNPRIPSGIVEYSVGTDLIHEMCGDNAWARIAVEFGHARLCDVPKELLGPERLDERQKYLASLVTAEKRWEHARARVEEHKAYVKYKRQFFTEVSQDQEAEDEGADAVLFGHYTHMSEDQLIQQELKILDRLSQ